MCCRMYGRKDIFRKNNWNRDIAPGGRIPIRTKKGTYLAIWGGAVKPNEQIQGHARSETLQSKWLEKGWHLVDIADIALFSERNTVRKDGEIVRFTVPDDYAIRGVARMQDIGGGKKVIDVRIVTEAAKGAVKPVHHRMPMIREAQFAESKDE